MKGKESPKLEIEKERNIEDERQEKRISRSYSTNMANHTPGNMNLIGVDLSGDALDICPANEWASKM